MVYVYLFLFAVVLLCFKLLMTYQFGWSEEAALGWRVTVLLGVLVLGYQYLARVTSVYEITPLEVTAEVGILSKQRDSAPLNRITNFRVERPFIQRILGQANLLVDTAGGDEVELTLLEMRRNDAEKFAKLLSVRLGQQKIAEAGDDETLRMEREQELARIGR
jgi:uncharacterized membrane protein YdbT with pleckstrin-like domain